MKKIISLLLVVAMVMSFAVIGAAADEEYPVIRWAYSAIFPSPDEELVEEALNEILRETCHAEIDLIRVDFSNMQQQLNLLLTGGKDSIDVFSSFWYMPLNTLYSNGQLADMTELIKDYPEVMELFADYPEVLECCKIDGKLVALPTVAPYSSPMVYLCKKTDSDSANIDWTQIDNYDQVTEALLAMKEVNPDHYYIPGATETYYMPKDIDYLGDTYFLGVLTDPANDTTVVNYYESEYFLNFMKNVQIWVDNDLITPDPMSNQNPTLMSLQFGLCSGTPGYSFDAGEFCDEANMSMQYGDEMVGTNLGARLITTGNIATYLWHVTSFSQNKEAAMRVLAAFYTDSRLDDILGNGVEGSNYVMKDGVAYWPEGKDNTTCGWTGLKASYSLPNASGTRQWFDVPANFWELAEQTNKESIPSLALGFSFDPSPVADQVTACTNVYNQYYLPLINGECDIDTILPVFQQALHDAGIDAIIAEKQAQLDSWLAAK